MAGRIPGCQNKKQTDHVIENPGTGVKPQFIFCNMQVCGHKCINCPGQTFDTCKNCEDCKKNTDRFPDRDFQCFVINEHNHRQQRKQEPSGGNLQGTANRSSQNTDSQKKRKKPCSKPKRCLSQIAFYRQICQQYTGNDYRKFKYRAKYVSHFRTSFGTEIP